LVSLTQVGGAGKTIVTVWLTFPYSKGERKGVEENEGESLYHDGTRNPCKKENKKTLGSLPKIILQARGEGFLKKGKDETRGEEIGPTLGFYSNTT